MTGQTGVESAPAGFGYHCSTVKLLSYCRIDRATCPTQVRASTPPGLKQVPMSSCPALGATLLISHP